MTNYYLKDGRGHQTTTITEINSLGIHTVTTISQNKMLLERKFDLNILQGITTNSTMYNSRILYSKHCRKLCNQKRNCIIHGNYFCIKTTFKMASSLKRIQNIDDIFLSIPFVLKLLSC